jgi:hypothetical protein
MGNVYLSFSPGGYPLAVKVVQRAYADDPEFRLRFRREIAAAQRVQGYYIAPVRDAGPDDEIPWYATAYVAGPSLQAAVAEHGPFPAFSVYCLLAGAAEGVAAVHAAGLVHRDLKPGNVVLAEDGPRVIDFGLAQADAFSRLTGTGVVMGTPAYMAPEQVRGTVTEATDVFALGHLALFAATGHTAFSEGDGDALFYRLLNDRPNLDGCPGELHAVIASCLAKNPADRPSVGEVAAFACAEIRGQVTRLDARAWLPPPVAESLGDYAVSNAPPSRTVAGPASPVPPPDLGAAPASAPAPATPLRRLLRPAVLLPAAFLIAAGAVLGFVAGQTHAASAGAAAPATTLAASPAAATSGSGPTAPDGYVQAYAGYAFTMPGGSCTTAVNPSDAVLASSQPYVDTKNDGDAGDMEINCAAAPELTFSDIVAPVRGTPDAAGCVHALTTAPMVGPASYQQFHPGTQFCLTTTSSSSTTSKTWVMLITLKSLSKSSDDLAWTATAWYTSRPAS